ncbi:MAG: hypothetical protein KJ858_06440, partial [Nanoarchaeota archaeon]|nr:hypothetical protein [Nanoarchaeota archaeon]
MIAQSKPYLISRNFCKKIYHQLKKPRKTKFHEIISIELSTLCNAKCKFCPHSNIHEKDKKRAINMSEEVFRKII